MGRGDCGSGRGAGSGSAGGGRRPALPGRANPSTGIPVDDSVYQRSRVCLDICHHGLAGAAPRLWRRRSLGKVTPSPRGWLGGSKTTAGGMRQGCGRASGGWSRRTGCDGPAGRCGRASPRETPGTPRKSQRQELWSVAPARSGRPRVRRGTPHSRGDRTTPRGPVPGPESDRTPSSGHRNSLATTRPPHEQSLDPREVTEPVGG